MPKYTVKKDRDGWFRIAKNGRIMRQLPPGVRHEDNLFRFQRRAKEIAKLFNLCGL